MKGSSVSITLQFMATCSAIRAKPVAQRLHTIKPTGYAMTQFDGHDDYDDAGEDQGNRRQDVDTAKPSGIK